MLKVLETVSHEDELLRKACLTEVQWKTLLIWASTQPDEVYKAVWRAHEAVKVRC